jgi:hypothetical protein
MNTMTPVTGDNAGKQVIDPSAYTFPLSFTLNPVRFLNFTNKVSYDYNGQDTPFSFNNKMEQQKMILNQYYRTNSTIPFIKPRKDWPENFTTLTEIYTNCYSEEHFDKIYKNELKDKSDTERLTILKEKISSWTYYNSTTPPGNDYRKYAHENTFPYEAAGIESYNNDGTFKIAVAGADANKPYLPELNNSRYNYLYNNDNGNGYSGIANYNDAPALAGKAAGVDCVGFIQNSASYAGNPYARLLDIAPVFWGTARTNEDAPNYSEPESGADELIKITSKPAGDDEPVNLDKLVPGDIVYYIKDGAYHVMMVADISYTAGRTTTPANIKLIESVAGSYRQDSIINYLYFVTKDRNLSWTAFDDKNWKIGRLMQ